MTPVAPRPTPAIERGLGALRGVAACVIEDGPSFHGDLNRWSVRLSLRRDAGARFIGATTHWYVLIDATYPYGNVAIHPAAVGGITVTFPHQARNTPGRAPRTWRDGKLCLDSPFRDERLLTIVRDPIGDPEIRLRWHVDRALLWLERAASDQLLATGDPFELPARPARTSVKRWERHRVVHDETDSSFQAWRGRDGTFGTLLLGPVRDLGRAIVAGRFADRSGETIREWAGRELEDGNEVAGFWWLWPEPIVLQPWEAPATWGELRRIARVQGVDADAMLRWLLPSLRGSNKSNLLLLGYPIPLRVGAPATEVHWDALVLPPVPAAAGKPPRGFRPNAQGWWHRDRHDTFADKLALQYLPTENWSPERLQARGRLPRVVQNQRILVLGVGALGSILAELLVRMGVQELALVDGETLEAGNICRHTATLVDVGQPKVKAVAQRLRQLSPMVRVVDIVAELDNAPNALVERLDEYDVNIDCTGSDKALMLLAEAWWSIPRTFASFSMGYGGKRLFSFGANGHRFPHDEFAKNAGPWLQHEANACANDDAVLEGAGCWSPIFPARYDDVVLAAATCVKELETIIAKAPVSPRFRVFAQAWSDDNFLGFTLESEPPSSDVTASQ